MSIQVLISGLLCLTPTQGGISHTDNVVTKDELIAFLDAQREHLTDHVVILKKSCQSGIGLDNIPDHPLTNGDNRPFVIEWQILRTREGHWVRKQFLDVDMEPSRRKRFLSTYGIYTWDGVRSMSVSYDTDENRPQQAIIDSVPDKQVHSEHWAVAMGMGFYGDHGTRSVRDFIMLSKSLEPTINDRGESELTFVFEHEPTRRDGPIFIHELRVTVERWDHGSGDGIRLREILLTRRLVPPTTDDEPSPPLVASTSRLEFGPPSDRLGPYLPTQIYLTNRRYGADGDPGGWMECQFDVVDIRQPSEIERPSIEKMLVPSVRVWDMRYRIGYEIGSKELNLDGRVLHTHRPLDGIVGENLEYWIEHGSFDIPIQP